jgi:hypothetical protein
MGVEMRYVWGAMSAVSLWAFIFARVYDMNHTEFSYWPLLGFGVVFALWEMSSTIGGRN